MKNDCRKERRERGKRGKKMQMMPRNELISRKGAKARRKQRVIPLIWSPSVLNVLSSLRLRAFA
jgi:hypothetical protein